MKYTNYMDELQKRTMEVISTKVQYENERKEYIKKEISVTKTRIVDIIDKLCKTMNTNIYNNLNESALNSLKNYGDYEYTGTCQSRETYDIDAPIIKRYTKDYGTLEYKYGVSFMAYNYKFPNVKNESEVKKYAEQQGKIFCPNPLGPDCVTWCLSFSKTLTSWFFEDSLITISNAYLRFTYKASTNTITNINVNDIAYNVEHLQKLKKDYKKVKVVSVLAKLLMPIFIVSFILKYAVFKNNASLLIIGEIVFSLIAIILGFNCSLSLEKMKTLNNETLKKKIKLKMILFCIEILICFALIFYMISTTAI